MTQLIIRILVLISCIVFASLANAASRTALVIGNSAYPFGPLVNPANDAKLIAETLRKTGFEVTIVLDANRVALQTALLDFSRDIRSKDTVGLFYYAGHGAQVNGANYLIPVDADIKSETEVKIFGINVDEFISTLERADGRTNIVILDACRNNPFGASTRSANRGMALPDAPAGTFVALSTSPGAVALDGEGQNSPYAEALSQSMLEPNVSIEQAFKVTRRLVLQNTKQKQVPWETSSLTGDFFFLPQAETPAPVVVAAPEAVVEPVPQIEEPPQVAVAEPMPEVAPAPAPATADSSSYVNVDLQPRVIPVGKWPEGLVMADGGLWVASSGDRKIIKIDVNSGEELGENPVGRLPVNITADPEGSVYAAVYTENRIYKRGIDGSGKTLAPIKRGYLSGLDFGSGALYAVATIEEAERKTILSRIDPKSGKVTNAPLPISGESRAFVVAQDAPWILFTDGTVAMYDAKTLEFMLSTPSAGGFMWSMGANLDAVFVGGQEQQQVGKSIVQRHAQGHPEDKTSQLLDSEELITAIAANDDRVVALGEKGSGWVLDAISLTPLKHFNVGAPPQSAIIDEGKLYVTTHQGQGDNGSVLVFDGLLN
jgi:outer membrane protein assembly factor BamB